MSRRTKASYTAVTQVRYPDNTTGNILPSIDRTDRQDLMDSVLFLEDDAAIIGTAIDTVTGDTTLDATHRTLLVDATAAEVDITLPNAAVFEGKTYEIIKKDVSANLVTVIGTVSGGVDRTLETQWAGYVIKSDGTIWVLIGIV